MLVLILDDEELVLGGEGRAAKAKDQRGPGTSR
jgi:hypothetical protein